MHVSYCLIEFFLEKFSTKKIRMIPLLFYIEYSNIYIEHLQVKTQSETYFHIIGHCYFDINFGHKLRRPKKVSSTY